MGQLHSIVIDRLQISISPQLSVTPCPSLGEFPFIVKPGYRIVSGRGAPAGMYLKSSRAVPGAIYLKPLYLLTPPTGSLRSQAQAPLLAIQLVIASPSSCHSERSEESLFLKHLETLRFAQGDRTRVRGAGRPRCHIMSFTRKRE